MEANSYDQLKMTDNVLWNMTDHLLSKMTDHVLRKISDYWLLNLRSLLNSAVGLDYARTGWNTCPASLSLEVSMSSILKVMCHKEVRHFQSTGQLSSNAGRSSYKVPGRSS